VSPAVPIDPTAAAIIEIMEGVFPQVDVVDDAVRSRALAKDMPKPPGDPEAVARVEDRTIPGPDGPLPVRIYRPTDGDDVAPGIVYFHGGGWVICDLDSHDATCRRLTNAIGAVVVSVDYRLAPEHPYPAAVEDCYAAAQWTAGHAGDLGIDPARLGVAGDSAGGNLAAAVALMARDRAGPALASQLMIYPVIDNTERCNDYPSKTENATGYFLTTGSMVWYRDQYAPEPERAAEPYCSPLRAESLAGLPPAVVITAEMDPLRDEGEHYAELLAAAGVPVLLHRADGMFHGFFAMPDILDGAKQAHEVAAAAVREHFDASRERTTR
jgi:acetyl esterase